MKKTTVLFAIFVLVLSSLACQALAGGNGNDGSGGQAPSAGGANGDSSGGNSAVDTDFPLTDDAFNITITGGTTLFQTKLSLEEVMDFYRAYYEPKGYTEDEILTELTDNVFNLVFVGDPSGDAVVIQGVDLGNGSTNVSIRLEGL